MVTALRVEAEVSAVLMRCLRLPAAHLLYSGVALSLRQMRFGYLQAFVKHSIGYLEREYCK